MVKLCEISQHFLAKFCEIIHSKFRKINFHFRINFVFREIEKTPFVSTLVSSNLAQHLPNCIVNYMNVTGLKILKRYHQGR
jgi:hypothetical protein